MWLPSIDGVAAISFDVPAPAPAPDRKRRQAYMQLSSPPSRLQELRRIPPVHSQTIPIRQGEVTTTTVGVIIAFAFVRRGSGVSK